MPSGFLGGGGGGGGAKWDTRILRGGRGTKNIRARENRMKPVVRTSFLGAKPCVSPPPAVRFSVETNENRNKNWACPTGRLVIATIAYSVPGSDLSLP